MLQQGGGFGLNLFHFSSLNNFHTNNQFCVFFFVSDACFAILFLFLLSHFCFVCFCYTRNKHIASISQLVYHFFVFFFASVQKNQPTQRKTPTTGDNRSFCDIHI